MMSLSRTCVLLVGADLLLSQETGGLRLGGKKPDPVVGSLVAIVPGPPHPDRETREPQRKGGDECRAASSAAHAASASTSAPPASLPAAVVPASPGNASWKDCCKRTLQCAKYACLFLCCFRNPQQQRVFLRRERAKYARVWNAAVEELKKQNDRTLLLSGGKYKMQLLQHDRDLEEGQFGWKDINPRTGQPIIAKDVIDVTRVDASRHGGGCGAAFPRAHQPTRYACLAGHDAHPRVCGSRGTGETVDSMDKKTRKAYCLLQEAGDGRVRHLWTSCALPGYFDYFRFSVTGITIWLWLGSSSWLMTRSTTIWLLCYWWFIVFPLCWRCCADRKLASEQATLRQPQPALQPPPAARIVGRSGQPTQQQMTRDVEMGGALPPQI